MYQTIKLIQKKQKRLKEQIQKRIFLAVRLGMLCYIVGSSFITANFNLEARGKPNSKLIDVAIAVYQAQASFQLSPLYYAQTNGLYAQQYIRLTIYYAGSIEEALRLLEQGRVHGALLPPVSIVRAIYEDRQLGIFMQYMHQSPYTMVSAALPNLRAPNQLIGKRLGLRADNYDARLAMILFLASHQLGRKVQLVQTPTDPINALLNRSIDAAITNHIQVPGLLDGQEFPYLLWQVTFQQNNQVNSPPIALPGDAFVAMRSYLSDQNRALLQRFARVTLEAMQVLVKNPDRTAWDVVLPYEREFSATQIVNLQKELRLLAVYILGSQDFNQLGTALAKEYTFLLKTMEQVGMISSTIPTERLFLF